MAGGINISTGASASLAAQVAVATVDVISSAELIAQQQQDAAQAANGTSAIPFRSPIQNKPAQYYLYVDPASSLDGKGQMYVFDAVKVANYSQRVNLTKAPLQTGYNISYHAVKQQAMFTLEIAMSDAMAAFADNMWVGAKTKSISAFQTLQQLMTNRTFMTLATRQSTYSNVMLIGIDSPEDVTTYAGMKAALTFEQVFLVGVNTTTTQSARPNATNETQLAQIQPTQPTANTLNQSTVTGPALDSTSSVGSTGPQGVPVGGESSSLPLVIYDENGQDITYKLPVAGAMLP